jgi:uncharacterized damage-inducible protein DinB
MQIKQYLIDTFRFNDHANKLALKKVGELADKDECIRYFSHLINSMNKWLARVEGLPGYVEMDWWLPVYRLNELESEWDKCLKGWLDLLDGMSEARIGSEVEFIGFDGTLFAASIKDIALQLNYHSIHHRAQIQYFIRQQGVEPDFVDYIGTRYRRVEPA